MSLSSLRSFSGAASLATSAFDTARFTLKAMAEAAVPPGGSETAADLPGGRPETEAMMAPAPEAGDDRTPTEKRKAGVRRGTVLDAYA